jgi:hypothetical protein
LLIYAVRWAATPTDDNRSRSIGSAESKSDS